MTWCILLCCFKMSHILRNPVFWVSNHVRLKPAYSAAETSQSPEILHLASIGIILSKQQTTKALIRQRGCAGWSAPLLFAYGKSRFSHDVAEMVVRSSQDNGFYNRVKDLVTSPVYTGSELIFPIKKGKVKKNEKGDYRWCLLRLCKCPWQKYPTVDEYMWASSRENLPSGSATR